MPHGGDGPGRGDPAATLELADWRRAIATLYADVRRLAARDPAAAHDHWRAVRERLYREHPQSPVSPDRRSTFRATHFAHDPRLRFEVRVEPVASAGPLEAANPAQPVPLPMSVGDGLAFQRIGQVTIPFYDAPAVLELFWMAGYAGGLFLPFRDATNGAETYGAGRYLLDAAKSADLGGDPVAGTLILDFNFAFQPSCAFDPRYACPLAPPANRLDRAIRAGERLG
jgi:uncharacterized protein (DUF1684 family)